MKVAERGLHGGYFVNLRGGPKRTMERNAKVESRASMRKAIHFESLRILTNPEKQYAKKCALKKLRKAQGLLVRGLKTLSEALYRKH
jgi:hypothetical protein